MSNTRNWKAITNEVFEQTQNTLINKTNSWFVFFSKSEEKYEQLENLLNFSDWKALFVRTWKETSHVFELNSEDMERLIDNKK